MFVLNFHGVGEPKRPLQSGERETWIAEKPFLEILDYAGSKGNIELTFDDANESDCTVALAALQARGMKARFFVVADRVDRDAFLSREQVGALLTAGMEIGSHGMRHRRWTGLSADGLHEELVAARDRLEQLTRTPVRKAACPFGSYNRRVIRALREAGYDRVYTSDGGLAQTDALIWPRNSVCCTWSANLLPALFADEAKATRRLWRRIKQLLKRWR